MLNLALNKLTISRGNQLICRDLCLQLAAGEMWAILGPNGVGKTTLLHTMAGLHLPEQGEIYLHNQSLLRLSLKHRARLLGLLFQQQNDAFAQTVLEYCLTSRYPHSQAFANAGKRDEQIVRDALASMELTAHAHTMLSHLSGGERKRVALAALITQDPSIYLLDEPTNHLDSRYQLHVLRHFQQLAFQKQKSVLLTTHVSIIISQLVKKDVCHVFKIKISSYCFECHLTILTTAR